MGRLCQTDRVRVRREHVIAGLILAWSAPARALHSKNEYAFVGCGKRRVYECTNAKCENVTNRKVDVPMPNAACFAAVTVDVAMLGCACASLASRPSSATPPPMLPVTKDACATQ